MIAFSLMILFLTSTIVLSTTARSLREEGVRRIENAKQLVLQIATSSDYLSTWGRDSCDTRLELSLASTSLHIEGFNLGTGNTSTDMEVRNKIVYLAADGTIASSPDLYIIDTNNPTTPSLISSLNTGPGLSALDVAGPYIYAANAGTTNQLQIIDISNRASPVLLSKFKLPLPEASTTPPFATSIFYNKSKVYLGTEKWGGKELAIIDVADPANPSYLGGFETGTQINSIYVRDNYAYLAGSDAGQLRVIDISNPASPSLTAILSPSGWETQIGKTLSYFDGKISLGRTTGGFNVLTNHEIFSFSTTSPSYPVVTSSHDIPGGVYGILDRHSILLATKSIGHELQLWSSDLVTKISEKTLGFQPAAMSCDTKNLYFVTGTEKGIGIMEL